MTDILARLLRYDVWANREMLDSIPPGNPPPRSLRWMNHIVAVELLWLSRMARKSAPLPVWPDMSLENCAKHLNDLSGELIESLNYEPLSQPVAYTNSKGESWNSTIEDILTHVAIHSAYHRGQIASDLRTAGHEPAYTDYIHAIRQRFIE
jgi:uncharacterized damage-inducible protein DinB